MIIESVVNLSQINMIVLLAYVLTREPFLELVYLALDIVYDACIAVINIIFKSIDDTQTAVYVSWIVYMLMGWVPYTLKRWLCIIIKFFFIERIDDPMKQKERTLVLRDNLFFLIPFFGNTLLIRHIKKEGSVKEILAFYGTLDNYIKKINVVKYLGIGTLLKFFKRNMWKVGYGKGSHSGYLGILLDTELITREESKWFQKRPPWCVFVDCLFFRQPQ